MINSKVTGIGDPVVIMHGLFGSMDNWRTMAGMLDDHFKVILVDLRNHGKSFWSENFNYQIMARDILELLDHYEIDQSHIIGHSMGGKVALTFAQKYPGRVKKIVVLDIASKKYAPYHQEIFSAILSMDLGSIHSRTEADHHLRLRIHDKAVRQFLLKSLTRNIQKGFAWKTNFAQLYENYNHILSEVVIDKIQAETLFIKGSRSNYIQEEDVDYLKLHMKNVLFAELDAGHWIHADRPAELFELLTSFFVLSKTEGDVSIFQ